ncbi:MAG: hypothetical protein V2B14_06365 [bacterium]
MEVKKSTKLPEGVGRKIIEALKNQSEVTSERQEQKNNFEEMVDSPEITNMQETELPNNEAEDSYWNNNEYQEISYESYMSQESNYETEDADEFSLDSSGNNEEEYSEECDYLLDEKADKEYDNRQKNYAQPVKRNERPEYKEYTPKKQMVSPNKTSISNEKNVPIRQKPNEFNERTTFPKQKFNEQPNVQLNSKISDPELDLSEFESPTNVSVLIRLINQLPSGVTRHTGAQIIRQTMEAMGISMNKVLTEAQQVQDEIEHSIRDNMNTIEEYKNNIKILEKEVQKRRKKADELEDVISLFILSEKELN